MQAKRATLPSAAFQINRLKNGNAEVVFWENWTEVKTDEGAEYQGDEYILTVPYHSGLTEQIETNYEKWISKVRDQPQAPTQEERLSAMEDAMLFIMFE